jgi:hypothetical protein
MSRYCGHGSRHRSAGDSHDSHSDSGVGEAGQSGVILPARIEAASGDSRGCLSHRDRSAHRIHRAGLSVLVLEGSVILAARHGADRGKRLFRYGRAPFGVRIPQQKAATVHANPWSCGECRPITLPPPTPAAIYPADSLGVVSAAALSDPAPCFIGQQDRLHHALEQSERRRCGRPLGPAPWQFRPAARS